MAPRHVALGIVLLSLALSTRVGGHFYLARRLVLDPQWSAPLRTALLTGIDLTP